MFGPPWKILGAPLPSPTSTIYHHSSTHHYYYPPPLPTTTRPEPSPTSTSYHHPSTHQLPPPTTATRPEPATTSISYHHSSTHHYYYPVVLPTSTTRHRPSSTTSTPAAFGPPCGVPQAGRRQTAPPPPHLLPSFLTTVALKVLCPESGGGGDRLANKGRQRWRRQCFSSDGSRNRANILFLDMFGGLIETVMATVAVNPQPILGEDLWHKYSRPGSRWIERTASFLPQKTLIFNDVGRRKIRPGPGKYFPSVTWRGHFYWQ